MRELKPQTEIRNLKAEAKRHREEAARERTGRLKAELAAKRATIESDRWQGRFDELLSRVPIAGFVPSSFPPANVSLTEQAVMRSPECATHGTPMHNWRMFRIEYGHECSCPEGSIWAPAHVDPDKLEREIAEALR